MVEVDITTASVNVLLEMDGEVYSVTMERSKLDVITILTKRSVEHLVSTGRTQEELFDFLGYEEKLQNK